MGGSAPRRHCRPSTTSTSCSAPAHRRQQPPGLGRQRQYELLSSVGLTNQVGVIKGPNNKYNRASFRLKATPGSAAASSRSAATSTTSTPAASSCSTATTSSGLLLGALRTPPAFDNQHYLDRSRTAALLPVPESDQHRGVNCCAYYDNPFFVTRTTRATAASSAAPSPTSTSTGSRSRGSR